MLGSPAALLIPLVLAFAIAAGLRVALGPERAPRFTGLAVPLAFLLAWGYIVRPGWFAADAIGRIGHITLSGLLLGGLLDAFAAGRMLTLTLGALALMVAAWTEVNGGFWPGHLPSAMSFMTFAGVSAAAIAVLWRADVLRRIEHPYIAPGNAALIQLIMLALSLAAVGQAAADPKLATGAFLLAMALSGYLLASWIGEATVPTAVLLTAAGGLFSIAWALCESNPRTVPGVALTALILFADGTAQAVPLPKAGISRFLSPVLLVVIAIVPLLLATVVTFALLRGA